MPNAISKSTIRSRIGALAVSVLFAVVTAGAVAQDSTPQPVQPAPAQTEGMSRPGVFESIGRWLDQSARNVREQWHGARTRVDDLNDRAAADRKDMRDRAEEMRKGAAEATRDAVDAVAKLPTSRIMSGRERCGVAPNGAPDCVAAAEILCRKHGFGSGKSMDFTSAEECPARALIGDRPSKAECTTVTFINRAMCQ
jgi:hypothetical protein